jgi:cytoskeletal protein CcmA (bactofilin family)
VLGASAESPVLGVRTGLLVTLGAVLGGLAGLVAGVFLAVAAAAIVPGGRPVVLGSGVVGAVLGAVVASWGSIAVRAEERSRNPRVEGIVSPLTFKRSTGPARPSTTPVWRPAEASEPARTPEPDRNEEASEGKAMQRETRDYTAPREHTTPSAGDLNALLGKGSEFEGKLAFEGKVRIDGTFTGEISTNDLLMVGEGAKVQAEISCGTVIVEGEVVGNIKATAAVELRRPAKVHGDITTPSLVIEKGVVFEGRSRMDELQSSNVVPIYATAEPGE